MGGEGQLEWLCRTCGRSRSSRCSRASSPRRHLSSSRICCGCLLIFSRSSFDIVFHSRSNNAAQYTQPSSEDCPRATNRTQFYNLGKVSCITQGHCDTLSPVPYGGQRDEWTCNARALFSVLTCQVIPCSTHLHPE